MNKQLSIKQEKEKVEEFILRIIENLWVGRGLLMLIMATSLLLFTWASGLKENIDAVLILFFGALVNLALLFSSDKRLREVAIFFAVMISVCFLVIVLVSGVFFIIINKVGK